MDRTHVAVIKVSSSKMKQVVLVRDSCYQGFYYALPAAIWVLMNEAKLLCDTVFTSRNAPTCIYSLQILMNVLMVLMTVSSCAITLRVPICAHAWMGTDYRATSYLVKVPTLT